MMSTYYFEGSPILAPLMFKSTDVVISSETANLKTLIHKTDAQRWDLSFGIVADNNEANILTAMIENSYTVKSMEMPQLKSVADLTTLTGQLTTSQAYAAGSSTIIATNTSGGLLPKGSFIQFANHSKIYIIKEDWAANGNPIVIYPNLRLAVNISTQVNYFGFFNPPIFNYLRDDNEVSGITYQDGILASIGTITLKEAL